MKYLKLKFLLMFFALAMAIPPAWAGEVTDVIDNNATNGTLSSSGNNSSSWYTFTVNGGSGAEYTIRSMGIQSSKYLAVKWNANGYLYATKSGGKLKSISIAGYDNSAAKTVNVYASNTAYTTNPTSGEIATLTMPARSEDDITYTFDESSDYRFVALKGTASSTNIGKITIVWETDGGGETPTTVATPAFSLTPATYTTAQNVEITCTTEGATIYYTTDGTTPTDESDEYTDAISITESTTLKAIAILGEIESDVATAYYGIATEPDPINSTYFQKVTSAEQIGFGRKYIVVFEGAENDDPAVLGAISTTSTKYGIPVTGLEINNAIVNIQDKAAQVLTLRGDDTNGWSFQNTDNKYLTWLSGNSLNIQENITNNAKWTIPNESPYVLTNIADSKRILQYNATSGNERFACYEGTQKDAVLYVQIPEPEPSSDPSITVDPTKLNIGEAGGSFTVTGRNLIDNIGVTPSTGFSTDCNPKPIENGVEQNWGFANNNGSVDGTVTVNYTGKALNAEGTVTMGTKIKWNPEQDTNATVTVNYLYDGDIYILGDYGNGWKFNDASHQMDNNNGIYTATFEVPANSYVVFARKLSENALWDDGRSYFGAPSNNYPVNQDEVSGNLDVNNHYVFKIENAGEYTFTVNANDETFNIKKTVDPSTLATYVKVTSADQLVAGKKYIFVQELDINTPQAMGPINSDYFGTGIPVTITDNKVTAPAEVLVFTLAGTAGNYQFVDKDGKYLRGANSAALSLGSDANNAKWILNNNNGALSGYRARNAQYDARSIKWHVSQNRFGHYSNSDVNSSFTFIYVEDDGTTPVVQTVETPEITPVTGTYTEAKTVTITCATEGAAISYKIGDGEYQPYSEPFVVSESCTITAKATKDGWNPSEEASVTLTINLPTQVNNLAEAKALADDTEFNFNGEVVVTFKQSYTTTNGASHTLIGLRDKNATEGGGVFHNAKASIYDALDKGKVLNPGWTADKETHEGWIQFEAINNVTTAENTVDVQPLDRTNTTLTAANQSEYIVLNNVTINGTTLTVNNGAKAATTYALYDLFNQDEVVLQDGQYKSLVGVVGVNGETVYVYPLEMTPKDNLTLGFDPASVPLYVGQAFTAPALTGVPEGVTVPVTYSSDNTEVATVVNNVVTLVEGATGTATITATFAGDANYNPTTATYTITVKAKEAAGLSFGEEPVTVNATYGDKNVDEPNLTNAAGLDVTYSTSDDKVAIVDSKTGEVTIVGAGTAVITATTEGDESHNGGSAIYTIVVAKAQATLSFDKEAIDATYGDENVDEPNLTNAAGLDVTYATSDDKVAIVDPNTGEVTIKGAGTATITATGADNDNYKGTTAEYTINVAKANAGLSFSASTANAVVGSDFTEPTLSYPNGLTVTYTSSNPEVATVDENGNVTIVGEGTTTITAMITGDANYEDAEVSYELTVAPQPVVAAPTFSLVAGTYGKAQQLIITAENGANILYSTDGSEPTTPYNGAIDLGQGTTTVKAVATKDGFAKSPVVTATYIIDIPEELPTITPFKGYYQIKNNGNGKYANIAGRKTLNFTDADNAKKMAGTVIWLETNDKGQVQSIRSQAADLQGYANRAMRYVPQMVDIVVNKINEMEGIEDATGAGSVLGETGLDAIMEKFNECFDYHLYVEQAQGGWRLYGKTPNMQHVVDFYRDHKDQVEAKLPKLEQFINDALTKLRNKIGGSTVFTDFSLHQIWEKMGGNLPEPVVGDDAAIMDFYRAVLNNKNYVWDFAYQTAQIYWGNVKSHPRYEELKAQLGEYADYIDEFVTQVRPDFKYYVIQRGDEPDYISEGNGEIISNQPHTLWTLDPRTDFTVNISGEQFGCPYAGGLGGYATTNYTDFAYTLPEGVTAYKVASVENGVANLQALSGVIPAQTPVLLMAKTAGDYVLKLSTEAGTKVTGNLLVGVDSLITRFQLKTPMVESLFSLAKGVLGEQLYNQYVAQYEYLQLLYAGTVNNKYFWGLTRDDVMKCLNANGDDCVVRDLSGSKFIDNRQVKTNKAFLVSETDQTITISTLRGDVNHDGYVNIDDVTALIDYLLEVDGRACPYCANVNCDSTVNIVDVTYLIDILLGNISPYAEGGNGN